MAVSQSGIAEKPLRSIADLAHQFAYQRGIEAVIWSMPAIADVSVRKALPTITAC